MGSLKKYWKSFQILALFAGITFLFNLPALVKCHGEVDPHGKSAYNPTDGEPTERVELAMDSD